MCGIVGILGKETKNKESIVRNMNNAIIHRGPDDDGFFVDDDVALAMRRLSIIDISLGKQPIYSEDQNLLIFFNGEIYNYKELREDLISNGYKFKTNTDTEVIVHLYSQYGKGALSKLRGMFAFCIYDRSLKKIFIARDQFGIKPLYYFKKDNKILAFSSEIKSILFHPDFKKEVNDKAVFNYLKFQYNPLEETFFKNIFCLKPGHFLEVDVFSNSFVLERYYSFSFSDKREDDFDKVKNDLYSVLEDSVKHHLIADVSVGSFLSGGVDSSIIAFLIKKVSSKKNKTFTMSFDVSGEKKEARETSDFLDTEHFDITVSKDEYLKELPKVVWHFDEPVADPSAVGLYFLAKNASKEVKVVLSGEGADELFGGYNIYRAPLAYKYFSFIPKFILKFFVSLPFEYFGKNFLKRSLWKLSEWYFGQKYFNKSVFQDADLEFLWKGQKDYHKINSIYDNFFGKKLSDSEMMQVVDINTWLVGDILAKADKMTMAHSLELRVPFLDMQVSSLATKIKPEFKWKSGQTKYILRKAFQSLIPETTRLRRKLGFPVPIKDWFLFDSNFIYSEIVKNSYIKRNFNLEYIKQLFSGHISGKEDNARKIYILYLLAIWYNVFIEK